MQKPKSWSTDSYTGTTRPEERFVDEAPQLKWSGLYDQRGTPLYRQPNPIGFEIDPRKYKR